jgi:hypothetical protein
MYIDEQGNIIVCGGFTIAPGAFLKWLIGLSAIRHTTRTRTRFIIDPENPVATVELIEHGIYAAPAQKAIMPGLLRLSGYLHVQKYRDLPHWYEETQPANRVFQVPR